VFAFVESGVGNLAQSFQVAAQSPDISPGDITRRSIEMLRTQGGEASQDSIDFSLQAMKAARAFTTIVWEI
jgi:hypothetical protein